jgi:flavin reductase (DIM6/NTAB) family NADH-FMN oxidoreductase RutF
MHKTIEPSLPYFGTPVVVVSTLNEDGSANIAPMSSAWFGPERTVCAPEAPVLTVSPTKCANST